VTSIAKFAEIDDVVRLRPSVSWVERPDDRVEFFFGNTRRQKELRVESSLVSALRLMDGSKSLENIASQLLIPHKRILAWASHLIHCSAVERVVVAEWVDSSRWRRSLHMLADFIPDHDLMNVWHLIEATEFVILGCGAVGSWVADGIARMGGKRFILVDPDTVVLSNLNRSLFNASDVGQKKTVAVARSLRCICKEVTVEEHQEQILTQLDLVRLIAPKTNQVVVSCMDFPNVDVAASLVNRFCVLNGIPLVVAGGYNLHLSLIGLSVIPGKTACFDCSLTYFRKSLGPERLQVKKLPRPSRNIGNIAPLAAITASIASMEAIRLAIRDDRLPPAMKGRRGEFNFIDESFDWVDIPMQTECPTCSSRSF
jgi:molybdopterin/thiamine biosynthesis adenylyltransferase